MTAVKSSPRKKKRIVPTAAAKREDDRRSSMGRIALLRMRVAAAEAVWKEAKEHASQAKRRRKLARLMAKRAKKEARNARARLDDAREALAQAEARSAMRGWSAASKKTKTPSTKAALKKRRPGRGVTRKSPTAVGSAAVPEPLTVTTSTESLPAEVESAVAPPAPVSGEIPATPQMKSTDL